MIWICDNEDDSLEKELAEEYAQQHPVYEKETGSLIGWAYPNGYIRGIEN